MIRTYEDYKHRGDIFKAKFDGRCAIDSRHRILRGDKVCFVQLKDNPHITIEGPVCKDCTAVVD